MANKINVALTLETSGFQRSLQMAEKSLARFGRQMANAGETLTQSLTLPLAGLAGAAVKSFADFEKLEKGLTAVMGSSEAAGAELEKLKEAARAPGLGFEEAVRGSIRLQAVGLSADEARGTLQAFGAAIAATGGTAQNLESVQYQLTQMISKNRILQEDFGILQENVPLLGKAVQAAFGTANIEQIRATGISATDFNARLVAALKTLPEVQKATGGLGNAFDNFTDNIRFSLAELGRVIAQSIDLEGIMNAISDALQSVVGWFKQLSPQAQKTVVIFAAVLAAIGPLLFIIGKLASAWGIMLTGFRSLISIGPKIAAAWTFITGPVGLTIAAIAGVIAVLVILYKRFEVVRQVINGVGYGFIELGKAAKAVFSNIMEGFQNIREGNFKEAAKNLKDAFVGAQPFELGKSFVQGFAEGFKDNTDYLTPALENIKKEAAKVASAVTTSLIVPPIVPTVPGGGGGGGRAAVTRTAPIAEFAALPTLDLIPKQLQSIQQENIGLAKSFDDLGIKIKTNADVALTSFGERLKRLKEELLSFNQGLTNIINTTLVDASVAFGNFLGDSLLGKKATGRLFLADLLGGIATALEQLGKLAIATGIAVEGIKKALQTLNPIAAIAGGIALIALSKIVKAQAANLTAFANGGIVYGPTNALVGEYPGARNNPEVIAPLSKLRDLLDGGSGSMIAETRISGNDLLVLVRRAETRDGRIR